MNRLALAASEGPLVVVVVGVVLLVGVVVLFALALALGFALAILGNDCCDCCASCGATDTFLSCADDGSNVDLLDTSRY